MDCVWADHKCLRLVAHKLVLCRSPDLTASAPLFWALAYFLAGKEQHVRWSVPDWSHMPCSRLRGCVQRNHPRSEARRFFLRLRVVYDGALCWSTFCWQPWHCWSEKLLLVHSVSCLGVQGLPGVSRCQYWDNDRLHDGGVYTSLCVWFCYWVSFEEPLSLEPQQSC